MNPNHISKPGQEKVSYHPGQVNKVLLFPTVIILKTVIFFTKISTLTRLLRSLKIGAASALFLIGLNSGRRELSGCTTGSPTQVRKINGRLKDSLLNSLIRQDHMRQAASSVH